MSWLAVQGLVVHIAVVSFIVFFISIVIKIKIHEKLKEGDAMENRKKEIILIMNNVLFTISANLIGGAMLAKTFQYKQFSEN